ncbi:E3 SUMO-protein ligase ZBED1-like [Triplophysa rosa]|uniref:E3 SUMO-protein ligase ZBED1-like n=2 Tax=Triplophysa rosa TaxID=992332 RepID=UPI00254602E6|nr:E3 SUMO-protein ligase ZBED1-like [Triplophysa rosa]
MEGNAEQLVPKKNSTSVIWKWFGFSPTDTAQTAVICKCCNDKIRTSDGNTTNLFNHLKRKHPKEYADSQIITGPHARTSGTTKQPETTRLKQTTLTKDAFEKGTPYDRTSKRWKDVTDAVTFYLAKDMIPIKTVENEGFKRLLKVVDPRYEIPSRKYFSSTAIPQLYSECRSKMQNKIQNVKFFATTADLWSSRTSEPYLSLTVHFIHDWKLCSACLETTYFPQDHTGELIAQGLRDALECWRLKEANMTCMTTDSGANMVKALELNSWTRLQCFGHRLHLAIEKSAKDPRVERVTSVCKKVVSTFSFSWKKKRDLSNAQTELKLPQQKLITESPTRWGSRLNMIERVLDQEKAISQVLKADKKTRHLVPSWQDVDVMESVKKALSPLKDFTDALSGEDYVSISYVKPVLHLLKVNILSLNDEDTELTKTMKTSILAYLTDKYQDPTTDDLLDMASLVDPRFKTQYIDKDKIEGIQTRALSELESLLTIQYPTSDQQPTSSTSTSTSQSPDEGQTPPKKAKQSLASFLKASGVVSASAATTSASSSLKEAIEGELKGYLSTPNAESEVDPLGWWKVHEANFPRVSQLARKYLCIPATSAPSERAFSTGGNIVTCQRATLKPDKVNQLVFLSKNL